MIVIHLYLNQVDFVSQLRDCIVNTINGHSARR